MKEKAFIPAQLENTTEENEPIIGRQLRMPVQIYPSPAEPEVPNASTPEPDQTVSVPIPEDTTEKQKQIIMGGQDEVLV